MWSFGVFFDLRLNNSSPSGQKCTLKTSWWPGFKTGLQDVYEDLKTFTDPSFWRRVFKDLKTSFLNVLKPQALRPFQNWYSSRSQQCHSWIFRTSVCKLNNARNTMTMTMTMKITLLPCNTCSLLSNDITLTGYIQQSINCTWKQIHGKGERSRSLCVPISLRNIYRRVQQEQNSAGAMVLIINSSAMLHMLLLFCDMRKITIVLATIIREEKPWTLM